VIFHDSPRITACAAALCSVKNGFSSEGKTIIFTAHQTPTLWPINTKLWKFNDVGEFYKCAKLHCNQLRNGAPTYWWNITPMCIFSVYIYINSFIYIYIYFYFFRRSTARTTHPILTHDSSNDAVWSKEVPFVGQNDENLSFGGEQPQTPPIFWRQ